jgi:hypothetical protein
MAADEHQMQNQPVKTGIQKTIDLAARCKGSESSESYEFLEEQIGDLEAQAREAVQAKTDLNSLFAKLVAEKPLTPADLKALEMLIVGDAEYYLKYESKLDEWKKELQGVVEQMASLQISPLDVDGLMHLRALCREAHQILADLVFYFDAKERAAKFQAAIRGQIDGEGYRFLAEKVQGMLTSAEM